jgi:zinc protease
MKIRQLTKSIFGCLLSGVCLVVLAQTPADKKPLLNIQHWQTTQGTPVYFVRTPELPMINLQVIFTAGSAYDQSQWGIANLTANMLNQGTQQHNADQIADALDQVGAQFATETNRDVTIIGLRSLTNPQYLTPALQSFNELLSQANFPVKALDRVKQQTLSALHEQEEDPAKVAMDSFYANLYPQHPYGHTVLGTAKTIEPLTPEQVKTFYQRYFVSANAKIILVGDLDRATAEKTAEQMMRSLPKGTPASALSADNTPPTQSLVAVEFPSQQTSIVTGQLGIARQDPAYFPLMVGNFLLGQMPLESLLFEQVRNQGGLAYGVSSNFSQLSYRGPFAVFLQTRAEKKNEALDITRRVLREFVAQGPTPAQLQSAKQNLILHFPLELSSNEKIASVLAQMAINQRPLDYLDTYRDKINAVTQEQVQQAFQSHIDPNKMLTVMVGQK